MSKIECAKCGKKFETLDALTMHTDMKHAEKIKKPLLSASAKKKLKFWTILTIILGGLIGLFIYIPTLVTTLPPTDMQGHVEQWPKSQILKNPIPIVEFKHILEHSNAADERPGIIISYNCDDFDCSDDLISKLETFTQDNEHVYVAPFKNMDAKIVLTRLGRQKILEEYDEEQIRTFII